MYMLFVVVLYAETLESRVQQSSTEIVHGQFPGRFESTNLGRDSLSREIGRTVYVSMSYLAVVHF